MITHLRCVFIYTFIHYSYLFKHHYSYLSMFSSLALLVDTIFARKADNGRLFQCLLIQINFVLMLTKLYLHVLSHVVIMLTLSFNNLGVNKYIHTYVYTPELLDKNINIQSLLNYLFIIYRYISENI